MLIEDYPSTPSFLAVRLSLPPTPKQAKLVRRKAGKRRRATCLSVVPKAALKLRRRSNRAPKLLVSTHDVELEAGA